MPEDAIDETTSTFVLHTVWVDWGDLGVRLHHAVDTATVQAVPGVMQHHLTVANERYREVGGIPSIIDIEFPSTALDRATDSPTSLSSEYNVNVIIVKRDSDWQAYAAHYYSDDHEDRSRSRYTLEEMSAAAKVMNGVAYVLPLYVDIDQVRSALRTAPTITGR